MLKNAIKISPLIVILFFLGQVSAQEINSLDTLRDVVLSVDSDKTFNLPSGASFEEQIAYLELNMRSGSLELGYDGNNTGDILMSVLGDNFYWENETYGYAMLRLVFGQEVITGINEAADKDEVSIYPNPTSGIVNIKNASKQDVNVYDMHGKKIIEINNASNMETIDISKYAAGTYIISAGTKTQKVTLVK